MPDTFGREHDDQRSSHGRERQAEDTTRSEDHPGTEAHTQPLLSAALLGEAARSTRGSISARSAMLQRLQRTYGNRAVQRYIQRAAATAAPPVEDDKLAQRIETKAGSGSPLDTGVKERLEQGLGADLSGVRVHTDGEAAQLNREVDAVAFTTGQDIFFSEGTYNPHSEEGMRLLAHEATHTVQQASGPVSGTPAPGGVAISDPSDSYEQAAEQTADSVMASTSNTAQAMLDSSPEGVVQRKPNAIIQRNDGQTAFGVELAPTSTGEEIPAPVRAKMENTFGTDLSDVRVHTDGQAEKMGALAFASGSNVHFAQGKYDPDSQAGQELLGHELTHVVQQREGRVQAPDTSSGNTTVFQDRGLEAEADTKGAQAASAEADNGNTSVQTSRGGSTGVVQQKPVAQGILPALAGMGASLAALSAADAAAVAGAVLTAGTTAVQAGAAIQPGQTGVQTLQLPDNWMSDLDKEKLTLITQYRYINAFVEHWVRSHPGESVAEPSPETTSTTATMSTSTVTPPTPQAPPSGGRRGAAPTEPTTTDVNSTSVTTTEGGPAAGGGEVDAAIREAVKTEVRIRLLEDLNANVLTAQDKPVLWTDDDDHGSPDTFGTTGEIEFVDVKGTYLRETLSLSPNAAQIPNLVLPMSGQEVMIVQFRGGRMRQGSRFETGMNDDLSVNLVGGAAQIDQSGNGGHGKHTYNLQWNWDDNATHSEHFLTIDPGSGIPEWGMDTFSGTPED